LPSADARVAIPAGERQYHIGLGPGELADYILLPGDQDRTDRVAAHFDSVELRHRHREFSTATGTYRGLRVSCVSTGIGPDNIEIVVSEILALAKQPTLIRIGSCGSLQEGMELGDLVITSGSVRLETTTNWFVHEGYPAVAHHEAILALIEAAERLGYRTTSDHGTAPQSRDDRSAIPIRYLTSPPMTRQGVLNRIDLALPCSRAGRCRAASLRRRQPPDRRVRRRRGRPGGSRHGGTKRAS
jgi:hypothetical protein